MNTYKARAKSGVNLTDLLPQSGSGQSVPTDIQFMPPGRQTICPFVNGKPQEVTLNITPEIADLLNQQLQAMREKAQSGDGDMPFIDFNHEDAESSGEPTELYWGGDDAKTGGIRMKVNWTAAGQDALEGKTYRRFSPAWFMDNENNIIGISANIGGLVNRAAFTKIQPVVAKAGDLGFDQESFTAGVTRAVAMACPGIPLDMISAAVAKEVGPLVEQLGRIKKMQASGAAMADINIRRATAGTTPQVQPVKWKQDSNAFFDLVWNRVNEKKISFEKALLEIQRENPDLAKSYMERMRGNFPASDLPDPENHPFVTQAKALMADHGWSMADACSALATNNFPLYQSYLASQKKVQLQKAEAKSPAARQKSYIDEVNKAVARGLSFVDAASEVSGRFPDLYNEYRKSCTGQA